MNWYCCIVGVFWLLLAGWSVFNNDLILTKRMRERLKDGQSEAYLIRCQVLWAAFGVATLIIGFLRERLILWIGIPLYVLLCGYAIFLNVHYMDRKKEEDDYGWGE